MNEYLYVYKFIAKIHKHMYAEENEGQMNDRATADCEERDVKGKKKENALKCHTDKKLVFRKKRD